MKAKPFLLSDGKNYCLWVQPCMLLHSRDCDWERVYNQTGKITQGKSISLPCGRPGFDLWSPWAPSVVSPEHRACNIPSTAEFTNPSAAKMCSWQLVYFLVSPFINFTRGSLFLFCLLSSMSISWTDEWFFFTGLSFNMEIGILLSITMHLVGW